MACGETGTRVFADRRLTQMPRLRRIRCNCEMSPAAQDRCASVSGQTPPCPPRGTDGGGHRVGKGVFWTRLRTAGGYRSSMRMLLME